MSQYVRDASLLPTEFHETLFPYLSQPIVETCLRIPLWHLLADGKDRGLARKAFQRDLPAEVAWRGSKTVSGAFFWEYHVANLDIIRPLMLDGELVRAGIIDRNGLEKTLNRDHDIDDFGFSALHLFLSAEIWARKMQNKAFANSGA